MLNIAAPSHAKLFNRLSFGLLMSAPKVSIIVSNYNYGRFLFSCLDAITNQDYPNFEVIFIDDGSTDDSLEIAKNFSSRMRIISQNNRGVNSARNAGLHAAIGDYVALCDSDDIWEKNKLSLQMNLMSSSSGAILVSSGVRYFDSEGSYLYESTPLYSGDISKHFVRFPSSALVINGPSAAIFRRDLALSIGGFDEKLRSNAEDWDFFRRLSQLGEFYFSHLPLVNVRIHNTSRSSVDLKTHYKGNLEAIKKAMADSYYNWTLVSQLQFLFRFELQYLKASIKTRDPKQFAISTKNMLSYKNALNVFRAIKK